RQNRHTRLIGAENGGAEEARDEDMGDGHESLAERREQLQHAAAGDVPRVAGAIGRGRWSRGGRHGLAESIKSAASTRPLGRTPRSLRAPIAFVLLARADAARRRSTPPPHSWHGHASSI